MEEKVPPFFKFCQRRITTNNRKKAKSTESKNQRQQKQALLFRCFSINIEIHLDYINKIWYDGSK